MKMGSKAVKVTMQYLREKEIYFANVDWKMIKSSWFSIDKPLRWEKPEWFTKLLLFNCLNNFTNEV